MELITNNERKFTKKKTPKKHVSKESSFISVEKLSLSYSQFKVFEDVTFEIQRNAITTIVGPSGSGKSSLLQCFNRLIDFNPKIKVEGHINCCGQNILTTKNVSQVRLQFGLVFQKPNPFPVSIYKNLDIPLKTNFKMSKSERYEKIKQTLISVGLWEEVKGRLKSSALLLSGGQQQRLCIARCLVLDPELILMDEPTSSLDPISEACIENLMLELKSKVTILLVTHKMNQMRKVSDNVVLFWPEQNKTKVIAQGSLDQVLGQAQKNTFVYQYLNT